MKSNMATACVHLMFPKNISKICSEISIYENTRVRWFFSFCIESFSTLMKREKSCCSIQKKRRKEKSLDTRLEYWGFNSALTSFGHKEKGAIW